jgi:hypothetical protein
VGALTPAEAAEHAAQDAARAWATADLEELRVRLHLPESALPSEIREALHGVPECQSVLDGLVRAWFGCGCASCRRYGERVVAAAAGLRAATNGTPGA